MDPALREALWARALADLRLQMERAIFTLHLAGSQAVDWEPETNSLGSSSRSASGDCAC